MKLAALLATLTEEPLLITPGAHASLLKLFEAHATLDGAAFKAAREGVDICGDAVELPQAELIDGVMFVPISGPIGRGLGKFEKGAGAVDVDDIAEDLAQAGEDDHCRGIVLDIDSPGGMVGGTPELADIIAQVEKPIYAFSAGMMCSAAYWLGAACDMIFATKSADVANIGVYAYRIDNSKRYEAAGLKPEVISSGPYKGMGAPGVPLTKEQRQHLQDRINDMAEMFYQHVETYRPNVSRADMQGQAFKADAALARGLIDMIVPNISHAAHLLR